MKSLSQENVWKRPTTQIHAQYSIGTQLYARPGMGKAPYLSKLIPPDPAQAEIKVACTG